MTPQDDPEDILNQFPTSLTTQEDVLQGLHVIAAGLLHGVVAPTRAEPIRRTLETAAKTIAMRDTIKSNTQRPQITNNFQVAAVVQPSAVKPGRPADPFIEALGPITPHHTPLHLSEPIDVDPTELDRDHNGPLPEHVQRIAEARAERSEGKSALLASLQRRP